MTIGIILLFVAGLLGLILAFFMASNWQDKLNSAKPDDRDEGALTANYWRRISYVVLFVAVVITLSI